MLFGTLIEFAVGTVCIVLGSLLWKKQKVSLVHDYNCRNVREEDIPAYTRQVGQGLIVIGAGLLVTGVLDMFCSPLWWIPFSAGFLLGMILIGKAQKKYNGSVF